MNLVLQGIEGAGDPDRERVVLRANGDVNLDEIALFACHFNEGGPLSGDIPLAYWFSTHKIKEGDLVVLYTKTGTEAEKSVGSRKSYFFYWGLKGRALWTSQGVRPVVVYTPLWDFLDDESATEEPKPKKK